MFSGIIETKAKIISIDNGKFMIKNTFGNDLEIGQSIAHDGACMTIENFNEDSYQFFVMQESLDKTNFSHKKTGDFFNVERSLKYGNRVDGHFVSGHIDCTGVVKNTKNISDGSKIITIGFSKKFKNNIIEKGSVSVNGVSLTAIDVGVDIFSISLIPLTQEITNLGDLEEGDTVNLEFDMLGKYVIKNN